jgi:nucleotide-binding universal stress UspA family protein
MPPNYYSDPNAFLTLVDVTSLMREQRSKFNVFLRAEMDDLRGLTRIFKHGDPGRIIADYARRLNVDLIMMPTHGVGAFRRYLLGSVTAKVLHDAPCPVWTSAHRETGDLAATEIKKVLCAVDLRDDDLRVVEYAVAFARTTRAEIRVLHVVPSSEAFPIAYFEAEFVGAMCDKARAELERKLDHAGYEGKAVVRSGKVTHQVREEAIEWNADAIVIGRTALKGTLGGLRTQTYGIIREAPCPVLSV